MRRAQGLLIAGLLGAHLAAALCIGMSALLGGRAAAASAALAAAVVIAFYGIGAAVQVIVAEAAPKTVLTAAVVSYVLRVVGLLGLLMFAAHIVGGSHALHKPALLASVVATTTGWLAAEIWRYHTTPTPVFDTEYIPPTGGDS